MLKLSFLTSGLSKLTETTTKSYASASPLIRSSFGRNALDVQVKYAKMVGEKIS